MNDKRQKFICQLTNQQSYSPLDGLSRDIPITDRNMRLRNMRLELWILSGLILDQRRFGVGSGRRLTSGVKCAGNKYYGLFLCHPF